MSAVSFCPMNGNLCPLSSKFTAQLSPTSSLHLSMCNWVSVLCLCTAFEELFYLISCEWCTLATTHAVRRMSHYLKSWEAGCLTWLVSSERSLQAEGRSRKTDKWGIKLNRLQVTSKNTENSVRKKSTYLHVPGLYLRITTYIMTLSEALALHSVLTWASIWRAI